MSRIDLAREIGISTQRYYPYEKGMIVPRFEIIKKLSRFFSKAGIKEASPETLLIDLLECKEEHKSSYPAKKQQSIY